MVNTLIKTLRRCTALSILVASIISLGAVAHAATAQDQILSGVDQACSGGTCNDDEGTIGDTVTAIIDILSVVVGAVSVIMVIIGGLKYTSSQGDSSGVSSAKNTIIYAVIVKLVIGRVADTGSSSSSSQTAPRSGTTGGQLPTVNRQ